MHLVMFDVDGTLVDSAGFDGDLYAQAVREVLGVDVDRTWRSYEHVTDSGVLAELLAAPRFASVAADLRQRVERRFVGLVHDYCATRAGAVREIAGAKALVERLQQIPGVRLAVATGGWCDTALLKLRLIGLDPMALPLASASDAHARTAIMRLAEQRAMGGIAARNVTYFGDGPWDKRASAELAYDFIAVGTTVEHDVRFRDLRHPDAIISRLGV
jgi:phosphoglycolate phosphatase-like HAD superfamily hydrolase